MRPRLRFIRISSQTLPMEWSLEWCRYGLPANQLPLFYEKCIKKQQNLQKFEKKQNFFKKFFQKIFQKQILKKNFKNHSEVKTLPLQESAPFCVTRLPWLFFLVLSLCGIPAQKVSSVSVNKSPFSGYKVCAIQ